MPSLFTQSIHLGLGATALVQPEFTGISRCLIIDALLVDCNIRRSATDIGGAMAVSSLKSEMQLRIPANCNSQFQQPGWAGLELCIRIQGEAGHEVVIENRSVNKFTTAHFSTCRQLLGKTINRDFRPQVAKLKNRNKEKLSTVRCLKGAGEFGVGNDDEIRAGGYRAMGGVY